MVAHAGVLTIFPLMTMLGSDVRKVFETILPDKPLLAIAQRAKLQERVRNMDVVRLLRAMVIAAATGYGGRQADVLADARQHNQ